MDWHRVRKALIFISAILISFPFYSIKAPLAFVILLFIVGNLLPYIAHNRKHILIFFAGSTLFQAIAIILLNGQLIGGATIALLATLALFVVGFQNCILATVELAFGKNSRTGKIMDQEIYDQGKAALTNSLLIFAYMFVNIILLGIIFAIIPVYGVQYNGLIN